MIEPRIYRAAFVPALLAVVLVMFSLESRPRPLAQGLAADVVFDGDQAASTTRAVLSVGADRRAGTVGDGAAADLVARRLRARGFAVELDRFERDGKRLVNVIGRRAGKSRRQLVVLAARDAVGVPDSARSAADTAALLEIARVFEGRPSKKTLVLASVDGSAMGEVGTERLARKLDGPELVDGALAISGLGLGGPAPASVEAWSGDTTRAGIGLQRTVTESLRQEQGTAADRASPAGQLARLVFPIGIGAQGVLLEHGYDAVRLSGGGELTGGGSASAAEIDEDRLERLGRVVLRTLTALDQGARPEHGPRTYLTAVSQVLPGWVLSVLALTLIVPALVASVDALARARRRREPVGSWLVWVGAGIAAFAVGLGLAHGLALAGAAGDPPAAPVAPDLFPLDVGAAAVLAAVAVCVALAWLALRHLAVRRAGAAREDASAPGAAVAVALVLSLSLLALWVVNPYAALVLTPGLHLWLLGTMVDPPPPRRARAAMVIGGLLTPGLLVVYYLATLSLDPLSGAWYLFLLLTGGHVSLASALIGCALAGALGSVIAIARSRPPA